jgi:hypothetical protein
MPLMAFDRSQEAKGAQREQGTVLDEFRALATVCTRLKAGETEWSLE